MDNFVRVIGIRVGKEMGERLDDLARKEKRKLGAMARILLEEALNDRECAAAIRQADNPEIDMRFCSPHCRKMDSRGHCHCSAVVDSVCTIVNGAGVGMVTLHVAGDKFHRHEKCPYSEADFQRWQQYAEEDVRAMQELSE